MDDNLIINLLIMIFGGRIVHFIMDKDREINLPFILVYFILFSIIYHVGLLFFLLVFFIKKFPIIWGELFITSMLISIFSSMVLVLIDRLRKTK